MGYRQCNTKKRLDGMLYAKSVIECALVGVWLSLSPFIRVKLRFGFSSLCLSYIYFYRNMDVYIISAQCYSVYICVCICEYECPCGRISNQIACHCVCMCLLCRERMRLLFVQNNISIRWKWLCLMPKENSKYTNCTPLGKIKFDSSVAWAQRLKQPYTRAKPYTDSVVVSAGSEKQIIKFFP